METNQPMNEPMDALVHFQEISAEAIERSIERLINAQKDKE